MNGSYDSGLNGVAVDDNGALVNDAAYGVSVGFGVSGLHSWKHTKIGLDYSGGFSHYSRSFYDGVSGQSLNLSISHQLSRHAPFSMNNSAGLYGSNRTAPSLPQTVEFDPTTTYVPTNDFFDNRTINLSSQANLTIQRSTRLSLNFGGDGFLTRRRSTALYGVTGIGAHGDIQYRVSRRSTVGVLYQYMHYAFRGNFQQHRCAYGGRHLFFGTFAIHAVFGNRRRDQVRDDICADRGYRPGDRRADRDIFRSSECPTGRTIRPYVAFRLAKTVPRGTIFLNASHLLMPGNGLFLTSTSTNAGLGYNYVGLRHWAISAGANYDRSQSVGNVIGEYGEYSGSLSLSRQVARATHAVISFNARRYESGDFQQLQQVVLRRAYRAEL